MSPIPSNGSGTIATCTEVLPEREELFPEEEGDIVNTMDVTRKIYAIRMIEKEIERYRLQDSESRDFYTHKVAMCGKRIDFIKSSILAFLHQNNLTRLPTPSGTVYQKVATTKHWPEDELLLAWVRQHLPDALRVKQEPDKKAIGDHITLTGEAPEGYAETRETRLIIK